MIGLAWLRKSALEELSYRGHLALQAVGGLVTLAGLHYLAKLVPPAELGQGYFAFACVGLAAYLPARAAQAEIARQLRQAQLTGLLEPLALSPSGLGTQLVGMGLGPSASALLRAALTLWAGTLLFGLSLDLRPGALLVTALALGLGAAASLGLGLCSGAIVLHVRRSDPVAYLLDSAAWLGAGLVFPTNLLPRWAQRLGELLPATHVLRLARGALTPSATSGPAGTELALLATLSLACLAAGAAALSLSVREAKRRGALGIS
ncbi:MAG: hypothetical protein ACYCWW_09190 [Deltaproteobacteria bacterium]